VTIDFAERRRLRDEHYNATLQQIVEVHDDLRILRVIPDSGVPHFQPGQFVSLGLGNWESRPGSSVAKFGKGKKGPDYFRGAMELLHATYIGYHGDAHEWLTDNPELTKELLNRCGYWLFPKSIGLPQALVAGETVPLTLIMENRGVAPPYAPYELRVKLSRAGDRVVRPLATACKSWLPGAPIIVTNHLALPADLKSGDYDLAIALFDLTGGKERPVEFALKASVRDPEGYYKLASVPVDEAAPSGR
jgi:hypothetical protein